MPTEALSVPVPVKTYSFNAVQKLLAAGIFLLLLQGTLMAWLSRPEYLPSPPALSNFAGAIGPWREAGDSKLEPVVLDLLGPDDYLDRNYADATGQAGLNLFIAYYKTQYKAKSAHDPKVCLPGAGFNPISSKVIQIPIGGGTIPANYYLVAKDSNKSVVLYWYQTHDQALAGDQGLHISRLFQTFTANRTDMALVRVVVPVNGDDIARASSLATGFVQSAYPHVLLQFPARPSR